MIFKFNSFWKPDSEKRDNSTSIIQTAILVEMFRMLQEFSHVDNILHLQEPPQEPVLPKQLEMLSRLGFVNTEHWEEYNAAMENWRKQREVWYEAQDKRLQAIHFLHTLIHARETFGNETLLIPYDSFEQLMEHYNLVCGPFDAYSGDIPLDKISDIEKVVTLSGHEEVFGAAPYINNLRPITRYIARKSDCTLPSYLARFPFVMGDQNDFGKDFHGVDIWNTMAGYRLELGTTARLFICAPQKQMRTIEKFVSPRHFSDPFICAHTNHGILVFTRWGEEADDTLIKQHEQVNKMISLVAEKLNI